MNGRNWNNGQWALAVTLAAGLVACGGGGGGGLPPQSAATIDVSAANRDSLSHATAVGIMAISPVDAIPLGAGGLAAGRESAQAVTSATPQAWLGRLVALARQGSTAHARPAGKSLERALALIGPIEEPCTLSGTMTLMLDDRDNSASESNGDVFTMVFRNCKESDSDMLNGAVTTTFTEVGSSSFGGRMVFAQLLDSTANHSVTLNGAARLAFSQPSSTEEITSMTADGDVVATVQTHLFTDTVTLLSGFVSQASYSASVTRPGSTVPEGRTLSTVSGSLNSVAAGGIVEVSTVASQPIASYGDDAYPSAGVVQVRGMRGTLLLTGLSVDTVRLDLDTNDDGSFESSQNVTWDWLL